MKVDFIDLKRVHEPYLQEIQDAVAAVVASGQYVNGPVVGRFEASFADYTGAPFAIGTSNGTDALSLALMALDIGPGDEVLVPAFTFISPASCVARLGATPVFVDIDEAYGMCPSDMATKIGAKTKAVVAVHLFGQCCDPAVFDVADQAGLPVIEDAAQAVGATHRGEHAGTLGAVGCFSFFPTKNLGALGDAGMLTTSDAALADKLRMLRSHGSKPKYVHHFLGANFRLDPIQAAVLQVKLKYLDGENQKRARNAARYDSELRIAGPVVRAHNVHTFHQYCVKLADRDQVRSSLADMGVSTMIYYPHALTEQPVFSGASPCPRAEATAKQILALPIYPGLTASEQDTVIQAVNERVIL